MADSQTALGNVKGSPKTTIAGVLGGLVLLIPEIGDLLVELGWLDAPIVGGDGVFSVKLVIAIIAGMFGLAIAMDPKKLGAARSILLLLVVGAITIPQVGCGTSPAMQLESAKLSYDTSLELIATGAEDGWVQQDDLNRIEPLRKLAESIIKAQGRAMNDPSVPWDHNALNTATAITKQIAQILKDLEAQSKEPDHDPGAARSPVGVVPGYRYQDQQPARQVQRRAA